MELYITVSFWLGVFGLVVNLLSLLVVEYPKTKQETIGDKLFMIIVGGAFAVWAGNLLFN